MSAQSVNRKFRVTLGALAVATMGLSACAASIPPGSEVADELIDTFDISDAAKKCMHDAVANFSVPVAAGTQWKSIDDVADAADKGDEKAQGIIDDFFKRSFDTCEDATAGESSTAAG